MFSSSTNIENMSIFSENLRSIIKEKGLSSQNLALDLHIDPAVMSKVLNGKMNPPVKFIETLSQCKILGLDFETLKAWQAMDDYGPVVLKKAFQLLKEKGD